MAKVEISGTTILLFIDPLGGTAYEPLVCLTSNSITGSTDTINSSSKCGTSSSPGPQTNEVSFEGNQMNNLDAGEMSSADLWDLWKDKTNFSWKMGPAIPVAGDDTFYSTGFLSTLTLTYPDGVATYSGTISSDAISRDTDS